MEAVHLGDARIVDIASQYGIGNLDQYPHFLDVMDSMANDVFFSYDFMQGPKRSRYYFRAGLLL
jgi:hypothetical protein